MRKDRFLIREHLATISVPTDTSRSWFRRLQPPLLALVSVVVVLAFLPLLLVLSLGIWVPAAIIHETFGVHYTTFLLLAQGYHFVQNAHAFTLLYTYLPNVIVHTLPSNTSEFFRFQLYACLIYIMHGITLCLSYSLFLYVRASIKTTIMAIFLAFSPIFFTTRLVNALTINYQMLQIALYVIGAALIVRWLTDGPPVRPRYAAMLGILGAVAVSAKLTMLVTFVPFLLVVLLVPARTPVKLRESVQLLITFSIVGLLTAAILLVALLQFHVEYLPRFVTELVIQSVNPQWLEQSVPEVKQELFNWVDPGSLLFGFHVTASIWLLMLASLAVQWIRRPQWTLLALLILNVGIGAFLAYFTTVRTAPHTILEGVMFFTFSIVVLGCAYESHARTAWLSVAALVVLTTVAAMNMVIFDQPASKLAALRDVSRVSSDINALIEQEPDLPLVYVLNNSQESLIFPSVDLYPLLSGDPNELLRQYFAVYRPRVRFQAPIQGISPEPQILVIPEYLPTTADPAWPSLDVLRTYPNFEAVVQNPRNTCKQLDIPPGWYDLDLQFKHRATRVTACIVRAWAPAAPAPTIGVSMPRVSLALGRPTQASSLAPGRRSGDAVDGMISRFPPGSPFFETQREPSPWWDVDLGLVQTVDELTIWNRADCCQDLLRAFFVFTSETPFTSTALLATRDQAGVFEQFVEGPVGDSTTIPIHHTARFIRVQLVTTNQLVFARVGVWGPPLALPEPGSVGADLSSGKTARASSSLPGQTPERALDGDTEQTLAHSQAEHQPWWEVDLGAVERIDSLNVWNRPDCCQESLRDFYVLVSDTPFIDGDLHVVGQAAGVTAILVPGQAGQPTAVPIQRSGRYVRIQLVNDAALSLAEVKVLGARQP